MSESSAISRLSAAPITGDQASRLEQAIAFWLHAKTQRSHSAKTRRAYETTLASFRAALRSAGLDLDGDPRAVGAAAEVWAGRRSSAANRRGPVAPATIAQRLAIVSSFYSYAIQRGHLVLAHPIAPVERPPVQAYAAAVPLPADEVRQALAAIDRTKPLGRRDHVLLLVALSTGRRASELSGLRRRDLLLSGGRVTLTWTRTKGGRTARDRLTREISAILLGWLRSWYEASLDAVAGDAAVWPVVGPRGRGLPISAESVGDICRRHLGTSQAHALRHTFAVLMEQQGATVSTIQQRLGHGNLATTSRYLSALASDENPHAETIAQVLLGHNPTTSPTS